MDKIEINFTSSRPRFSIKLPFTKEEIHSRFKKTLEDNQNKYQGIINSDRIILRLRKDKSKY